MLTLKIDHKGKETNSTHQHDLTIIETREVSQSPSQLTELSHRPDYNRRYKRYPSQLIGRNSPRTTTIHQLIKIFKAVKATPFSTKDTKTATDVPTFSIPRKSGKTER